MSKLHSHTIKISNWTNRTLQIARLWSEKEEERRKWKGKKYLPVGCNRCRLWSICFDKRANDPKGMKMYHSDQNTLGNWMYEQPLTFFSYYAEIWGNDVFEAKYTGKYWSPGENFDLKSVETVSPSLSWKVNRETRIQDFDTSLKS